MATALKTDQLWDEIVRDFRRACLLKRAGKVSESAAVLNDALPKAIAAWSRNDPRDSVTKRQELTMMFKSEERRVEAEFAVQQLAANQAMETILPALRSGLMRDLKESVLEELALTSDTLHAAQASRFSRDTSWGQARPRIKFDDIVGVIDTVQAEQMVDFGARPAFAL